VLDRQGEIGGVPIKGLWRHPYGGHIEIWRFGNQWEDWVWLRVGRRASARRGAIGEKRGGCDGFEFESGKKRAKSQNERGGGEAAKNSKKQHKIQGSTNPRRE